jgi:hypothetical protein
MKMFRRWFDLRQETPQLESTTNWVPKPFCNCLDGQYADNRCDPDRSTRRVEWQERSLHTKVQDINSRAWRALTLYIDEVASKELTELNPRVGIGEEYWEQIVTLPPSIGRLQSVKLLSLYRSHLVRIPPEIGDMTNLEEFVPYTSRSLHWFPYEITRCKKLVRSCVSTRCLYGNYKYRPPFPKLPQISQTVMPSVCSVCGGPFSSYSPQQAWISLRVATDVLPLLVHACSDVCLGRLPKPAEGYLQRPHRGGLDLEQPPSAFGPP